MFSDVEDMGGDRYVPGVVGGLTMQVDKKRGVLYLHGPKGQSAFRMCRIPPEVLEGIPSEASDILIDASGKSGDFDISTEGGMVYLTIHNVPPHMFDQLESGQFVDITYGHHPVTLESGYYK